MTLQMRMINFTKQEMSWTRFRITTSSALHIRNFDEDITSKHVIAITQM